jgi:hypothetical protein
VTQVVIWVEKRSSPPFASFCESEIHRVQTSDLPMIAQTLSRGRALAAENVASIGCYGISVGATRLVPDIVLLLIAPTLESIRSHDC